MFNTPLILDAASPEARAMARGASAMRFDWGPSCGPMPAGRLLPGGAVGYPSLQRVDEGPARGVAYVTLAGVIGRQPMPSMFGPAGPGFTHTDDFIASLDAAAADPAVRAIVLRVDSPGGFVAGVTEAVRAVRRARAVKPVVALVVRAMSLGYWIACQADRVLGLASAGFGSLGIAETYEDTSGMAARMGVKVLGVATQEHKLDMTPGMPVTDEAIARRRASCEALNLLFVADVAQARRVSDEVVRGWAERPSYLGAEAVAAGLADAVIEPDQAEAIALAIADAREAAPGQPPARPAAPSTPSTTTSPTASSAGGSAQGGVTPSQGAIAMGFDPIKMQKDDPEGYAQARSHFKATFETEQKVEEEKTPAASAGAAAPTASTQAGQSVAASFQDLDLAIGKAVPNRDALIARAQRERMSLPQAMAAAQDEMAGRLTALETAQKNAGLLGAAGAGTAAVAGAGAGGGGTGADFIASSRALASAEKIDLGEAMSRVSAANPALYQAHVQSERQKALTPKA